LGGVEAGGSGGDRVVDGGDDSHSGFGWHFVGFDLSLEFEYGGVAEDECDFFFEEWGEVCEFWNPASELLFEVSELFLIDSFGSHLDYLLDEGLNGGGFTFLEMTRMLL
jgi:hypothetical protein